MLTAGDSFVAAVVVLIFRGERMLTMRRAADRDAGAGLWEGVSGRIEAGEQPLAAAAREVWEETALEVALDPRPVDAYVAMRAERPMLVVCFCAGWISGEVRRSDEHDAHAWLGLDELSERAVPARLVEAARRAEASLRALAF